MGEKPTIRLVPMRESHVPALAELERLCFSMPWSEQGLREELENSLAYFCVAEAVFPDGAVQVAGYAGMHCVAGECYVDNVAVFPVFRRMGMARLLMRRLIAHAQSISSVLLTLEVRESNTPACSLYESLGFEEAGRRKGFYAHPTEDALILTKYFSS